MATVVSGRGLIGLASRADKAAWVGDLVPKAGGAAEEGLAFMVVGVEGEEGNEYEGTEYILRKALTETGNATVAKEHSKRPGKSERMVIEVLVERWC